MRNVDLLTLSACNTAMGNNGQGSEVESFAVLAQKRGAAGVLATLWPVADQSTGLFMQEMYRLRANDPNLTKAKALQLAQIRFIRGDIKPGRPLATPDRGLSSNKKKRKTTDNYSHPYYWAPFILMGNWL